MRPLVACVASLVLACVIAACTGEAPVAATVNGTKITAASVDDDLEDIAANKAYLRARADQGSAFFGSRPGTYDAAVVAELLNQRITAELVRAEVRRRRIVVAAADVEEASGAVSRQLVDPATGGSLFGGFPERYRQRQAQVRADSDALQADEGKVALDDDSLRKAYDAATDRYRVWCIRHLLRSGDGEAAISDARARIVAGADFAEVAKAESDDPASKPKGGDLGCQTRDGLEQLVEPVRDAVLALQDGQLSPPVKSDFGVHLVQLEVVRIRTFEEVEPVVRAQQLQGADDVYEQLLRALRRVARVEVDRRFGRWDRSNPDAIRITVR